MYRSRCLRASELSLVNSGGTMPKPDPNSFQTLSFLLAYLNDSRSPSAHATFGGYIQPPAARTSRALFSLFRKRALAARRCCASDPCSCYCCFSCCSCCSSAQTASAAARLTAFYVCCSLSAFFSEWPGRRALLPQTESSHVGLLPSLTLADCRCRCRRRCRRPCRSSWLPHARVQTRVGCAPQIVLKFSSRLLAE